jgi:hypothetical protein
MIGGIFAYFRVNPFLKLHVLAGPFGGIAILMALASALTTSFLSTHFILGEYRVLIFIFLGVVWAVSFGPSMQKIIQAIKKKISQKTK